MNIAYVSIGFAPLRTAGLDIVGERLVAGLLARGHRITVIAGQREHISEVFSHPNLDVIRIPLGRTHWLGFGLRAAFTLRLLGQQRHFDVIHFWDVYFAWAFRRQFVGSLQHSFRQRITTSYNAGVSKKIYYFLAKLLAEQPAVHRAKKLLAGSETSKQEYVAYYKVPDEKIVVARYGVDVDFFRPVKAQSLRASLNIPPGDLIIMYSGFFTPRKGLEYLALAMKEIHPTPWLVLTGKWTLSVYKKFYAYLGAMRSKVIDVGFVPDERMPDYFSMADIYISPSLLEGFGLPLAESLACGTPVVAADAGAVSEVIGPGGILVPPADPHALAVSITNLFASPTKRKDLAEKGRKHVVEHFSLADMILAYENAYKGFCKGLLD